MTPATLPPFPRKADGTIDGGQCLTGGVQLYDVAGRIRADLIALQAQVRAEQARAPETKGKAR